MAKRVFSTCVIALSVAALSAAAGPQQELEAALATTYQLTKTGIDRLRITQPGTVLVVTADGIRGDLASDMTYSENKVVDGKVAQRGGVLAAMQGKETNRVLKKGDKVFVYKLDVKDDAVNMILLTTETYDVNVKGSTKQMRYKALLSFKVPKETLATMSVADAKGMLSHVVVPEAEAIATATAPKAIALGQTFAQVEEVLGKPTRIIDLGAKITWVYPDMKVVFGDGKIVDVQ